MEEEEASKSHLVEIKTFVKHLTGLSSTHRRDYINSLNPEEVNFLSEIVYNFLRGRIIIPRDLLKSLLRHRSFLYSLSSSSNTAEKRKKLFMTLKGLYVLAQLLPFTLKSIF